MRKSSILTLSWAVPSVLFLAYWLTDNFRVYFFGNVQTAVDGFATKYLPTVGVDPSIFQALNFVLNTTFTQRYRNLQLHILTSTIMAVILVLNLTPFIRKQSYRVHRFLGYAFLACYVPFTLELGFTLLIRGMQPMGPVINVFNHVALFTIAFGAPLGWYFARTKQIGRHRATMMFVAAAFMLNPCQRFWWMVLGKSGYGGPYPHIGVFIAGPTQASEVAAVCCTYGTALLYSTVLVPSPPRAKLS